MAIPNVQVNVTESSFINNSTYIPFIPAVIMKTKSGPIGTTERINSEAEFIAMFGQSDITTPAAFAFQKYLRLYQYAYVTRAADSSAANGEGKASFSYTEDETETTIDLFSVKTNYKTDLYNGGYAKLVYDADASKIYIDLSEIMGKTVTTIKEDINIGTVKAAERDGDGALVGGLEFILNKLVASANAITNVPVTITNLFVEKTATDAVPASEDFVAGFLATIQEGNSGNTTALTNANVKGLINLYTYQDTAIDVMVIPEYRAAEVVNYAVERGRANYFRVIAQTTGDTVEAMKSSVQDYVQDERGFLDIYANDVTYNNFLDNDGNPIKCPVSIAVLNAYGNASRQNSWCAIAGVNRGTLPQVTGLAVRLTKEEMDSLYDNIIPINSVMYISSVGYVVWGNKTSANADDVDLFDRINVARLVNYLNRRLMESSWEFLFEPITLTLFTQFKENINNICQAVSDQDGIDDFAVICDATNNTAETMAKNELHAQVQVKPTEALEYIIIDLDATDTITIGVSTASDENEEVW